MKVFAGCDHAGLRLKRHLIAHLRERGHEVVDLGTDSEESCDYPDFAVAVARSVRDQPGTFGLLVCDTGVGISIAANKVRGIRSVVASNNEIAQRARSHNDANVVCFGQRFVSEAAAVETLQTFLTTAPDGGRHSRRVAKITLIEEEERKSAP